MIYWILYSGLKVLSLLFFPFRVYGLDNLPSSGAFIIASNHISNLDPVIVGLAVKRKISYMAKDSLFKNKILGLFLTLGNAFPIKRDTADVKSMRTSLRRLKSGSPLLLFPEGTRGGFQKNKVQAGIGFLVAKSAVPVIPVRIFGSDKVLPPHAKKFSRHSIEVVFGQPIYFQDLNEYVETAFHIMRAIHSIPAPSSGARPVA